jgi:hypothetical protein
VPARFICHAPAGPAAVLLHLQSTQSGVGTMCDANDTRDEEIALFGDSNADTDSDASTLPLNGITTPDHMRTQQLHRRYFPNSNATSPAPMRAATSPTLLPGDLQSEPTSNNQALVVLPLMSQRQMRQRMGRDTAPDESAHAEAMAQERYEQLVLDILQGAVPSAEEETPNPAGVVEQRSPSPLTSITRPAAEEFLARAEMAHEDWLRGGVVQQRLLEDRTSQAELSMSMHLLHFSQSRSRMYRNAASVMRQDDPDSVSLRQRADMEDQFAERVEQVRRRARDKSFAVAEAHLQSKGNPCPCLIYHHTKPPSVISTILEVTSTTHSTYLHPTSDNSSGIPVWSIPLFLNMRMVWVGGSF